MKWYNIKINTNFSSLNFIANGRGRAAVNEELVFLADDEEEFDFKDRFTSLKAEFEAQLAEEAKLNQAIADNLAKVVV